MTKEYVVLWVCVDCMLADNGYDEKELGREFEFEPWAKLKAGEGEEITMGLPWEEHAADCVNRDAREGVTECGCEEIEFSRSECPACGSHLAGERHGYTYWLKIES